MIPDIGDEVRDFWDRDASTYDESPTHHSSTALQRAVWTATLARLLPPAPARILDVGAGTGFLSLPAARLGYAVTALDISVEMLDRLRDKAVAESLDIEIVEGSAEQAPGGFDAVIEHHVAWTLADPQAAFEGWREAAPAGQLVIFESAWGTAASPRDVLRARANRTLRRLCGVTDYHHDSYSPEMLAELPLGSGVSAEDLAALVVASGWPSVGVQRLRDVEWAVGQSRAGLDRLMGIAPCYAITGG